MDSPAPDPDPGADGNGDRPPVMLLDVDGVVNADLPGWPDKDAHATVSLAFCCIGFPLKMRWSPKLLLELTALHESGLVEIRWCTSWCPHIDVLYTIWDLPAWPVAWAEHHVGDRVPSVKLAAAREVMAQGRRLIWVDDEAIPAASVLRSLGMNGGKLIIRPNSRTGLSPGQIRQITAYAQRK